MGEAVDYLKRKRSSPNRRWTVFSGLVLLVVLVVLGNLAVLRPVILMDTDQAGIHVKNAGSMDALIHRVDGFWYWASRLALLANMPSVHQRVGSGAGPVRLQIPEIPTPDEQMVQQFIQQDPFYMKLVVRYRIPGIPMFRYTTPLYFKYDPTLKIWVATKSIPAKYRSLGSFAVGNIEEIALSFHEWPMRN